MKKILSFFGIKISSINKVVFIHNLSGEKVECYCQTIDAEYINDDMVFVCKVLEENSDSEKAIGIFSIKHFSMCGSKKYVKERQKNKSKFI